MKNRGWQGGFFSYVLRLHFAAADFFTTVELFAPQNRCVRGMLAEKLHAIIINAMRALCAP
jgi:hypothetical protein